MKLIIELLKTINFINPIEIVTTTLIGFISILPTLIIFNIILYLIIKLLWKQYLKYYVEFYI